MLFGSADEDAPFSVEGLSRQWMDQRLRPHSPLQVPMSFTNTTFGILCLLCHAHVGVFVEALLDEVDLGRIVFCVFSLWMCCVTKRRFIVLKEISLGTITLGESLRRLSPGTLTRLTVWLHLPAQALLGTRVRGEPAIDKWRSRTLCAAGSFKNTSSGTIATAAFALRLFVGHPSRLVEFSLLVVTELSRTFDVDCTQPSF